MSILGTEADPCPVGRTPSVPLPQGPSKGRVEDNYIHELGGCAQPYLSRTGLLSCPTATDLPVPPPGMLGAGFVPSGLSWPFPASSLPREWGLCKGGGRSTPSPNQSLTLCRQLRTPLHSPVHLPRAQPRAGACVRPTLSTCQPGNLQPLLCLEPVSPLNQEGSPEGWGGVCGALAHACCWKAPLHRPLGAPGKLGPGSPWLYRQVVWAPPSAPRADHQADA